MRPLIVECDPQGLRRRRDGEGSERVGGFWGGGCEVGGEVVDVILFVISVFVL